MLPRVLEDQNNQITRSSGDDHTSGLQTEVFLTVRCKVMLLTVIWTVGGSVKGIRETVKDNGLGSGFQPQSVLFHFIIIIDCF